MTDSCRLIFTIGPVQGFVTQARRTRDLWAGSWLLSCLAETALAVAERDGGTAVIPFRRDEQKGMVTAWGTLVGGVPNRFELAFEDTGSAMIAAQKARDALNLTWQVLTDFVWKEAVEQASSYGHRTKEIWDRQVSHFWEISWIIAPCEVNGTVTAGRVAAARKNLRDVPVTEEPGVKCSLMGSWQEISGHPPGEQQREFWRQVQTSNVAGRYAIAKSERLCAVALTKRLLPGIAKQAYEEIANTATLAPFCRELPSQDGWPSTSFFASLPWLRSVFQNHEVTGIAREFAKSAIQKGIGATERVGADIVNVPWADIDSSTWFIDSLAQNEWELPAGDISELIAELRVLYDRVDRRPIPFYALLLMDGDSMGRLLEAIGTPEKLSEALNLFAGKVKDIIGEYYGRAIYAGGDDVLAILPADTALAAAEKLSHVYAHSFEEIAPPDLATISGAIVYSHIKYPLRQVLETAHHLLDGVAKTQTGRNSLACSILQGSGVNAVWAAPWAGIRGSQDSGFVGLAGMIERFRSDGHDDAAEGFSPTYLYRLREIFSRLFAQPIGPPGNFGEIETDEDLFLDIAHAEYRRRMSKQDRAAKPPDQTKPELTQLMMLSRRWRRELFAGNQESVSTDPRSFSFDGWRLGRFLGQIKDGRMDDHT